MTRRVIQTDLFTAFQESQKRAEEQLGHKRAIRIEGSAVRRDEGPSEAPQVRHMHGFEVISSPTASAVVLDAAPAPAALETASAAVVEEAAPAPLPAPSAPTSTRERLSTVTTERVKINASKDATSEPVTRTVQATVQVPDASSPLLKVAGVVFAITAAFIVGRSTVEPVVKEVKIYVPTQPETPAVAVTTPAVVAPVIPAAPEVQTPVAEAPKTGKYTVLIVSGISKTQAEKLAAQIRKDSGYDAFVKGGSVYVGRFEKAFTDEINKVEKFCREYKYEGRAQFTDALQVPIPGTR
ncbi:MAG: hypothetical protein AB7F75_06255 [Planctomycetota bacterium]